MLITGPAKGASGGAQMQFPPYQFVGALIVPECCPEDAGSLKGCVSTPQVHVDISHRRVGARADSTVAFGANHWLCLSVVPKPKRSCRGASATLNMQSLRLRPALWGVCLPKRTLQDFFEKVPEG